ncbi:hypothetical protein BH10PSE1_BH10PSE1_11230 [soil metagenome]
MTPQLQTNNSTFFGRHWTEAQVLRRYFPHDRGLSILSFGCSTGEELLLLRQVFPGADITGCDHDWYNLRAARALLADQATVINSEPSAIEAHGPFDLIVCNSVLVVAPTQQTPDGPIGLAPSLWLEIVELLDRVLKPGGVIQVINSNFPMRLHPAWATYQPLRSPLLLGPHFVDLFSLDGRMLCAGVAGTGFSTHLNVHFGEDWRELEPDDLTDTHWRKAGNESVSRIDQAVSDELFPNLVPSSGKAAGRGFYQPAVSHDTRPASYASVELNWTSVGPDAVRVHRTATRRWFDGSELKPVETVIEMQGQAASTFFESMLGRPSTSLALEGLERRVARRSPNF